MRTESIYRSISICAALATTLSIIAGCSSNETASTGKLEEKTAAPQESAKKSEAMYAARDKDTSLAAGGFPAGAAHADAAMPQSAAAPPALPTLADARVSRASGEANIANPGSMMAAKGKVAGVVAVGGASAGFGRGVSGRFSAPIAAAKPAAALNPNMYVASNYMGGSGQRERIEKLISEGVLVDGKRVMLEAFSREYDQSFPIPTDRALGLSADTERTRIITDGDRTYLQVGLQAIKGEAPRRPPLNIALVIDRSGSMGSENKMEDAKKAARELVDRLRPDDTLSIVTFETNAAVLAPATRATNKAALKAKIDTIQPGGGTNIYDGLKLGFAEAAKNAKREGIVSLTILVSDGQVSSGVQDPAAFQKLVSENVDKHDIQTTTVGVGVAYNEDLMLSLAQEGKGNYHFLKDGTDATKVFASELDDLSQIVAKAVKVRVELAQGVGLVRVLGTRALNAEETKAVKADEKQIDKKVYDELGISANRQNEPEEPGIKMMIPNFHRGDSHIILMEIEVPKGTGSRSIATVHLKYKDLARPANRELTANAKIDYTTDKAAAIASVKRSVKKNVLGFQTGEAMTQAATLIAQGQYPEAVRVIDERMVVMGVAAKAWSDKDLDRDGKMLDSYKSVISQAAGNPAIAGADLGEYLKKSLTYNAYQRTR